MDKLKKDEILKNIGFENLREDLKQKAIKKGIEALGKEYHPSQDKNHFFT